MIVTYIGLDEVRRNRFPPQLHVFQNRLWLEPVVHGQVLFNMPALWDSRISLIINITDQFTTTTNDAHHS